MSDKKLKVILALLSAVFLTILSVYFVLATINKAKEGKYIGKEKGAQNTISISASSEVWAVPDLAVTNFSVVNEAKAVEEALSANSAKMNSVIGAVKAQGVAETDIKTVSFYISPRYEYEKSVSTLYPTGKRILVGYEVRNSLEVKIRDLSKVSKLIEGATAAGANEIGDLQFTIENEDALKTKARNQAIEKAKTKAQGLASGLGIRLKKIVSFSEGGYSPVPAYYAMEKASAIGMGGGTAPEIATGQNKIEVSVSITYEIE